MSWAYGIAADGREIGYSVKDICNEPGCSAEIDRGLSFVCGGMHEGGDHGCGSYFCTAHMDVVEHEGKYFQLCSKCAAALPCDHKWVGHKNHVPGSPDDYVEYCDKCGRENPGSWVPE